MLGNVCIHVTAFLCVYMYALLCFYVYVWLSVCVNKCVAPCLLVSVRHHACAHDSVGGSVHQVSKTGDQMAAFLLSHLATVIDS